MKGKKITYCINTVHLIHLRIGMGFAFKPLLKMTSIPKLTIRFIPITNLDLRHRVTNKFATSESKEAARKKLTHEPNNLLIPKRGICSRSTNYNQAKQLILSE